MKGQMADVVCPFPCRVAMPSFNAVFTFPWFPSVVGCGGFLPKKARVRGVSRLQFTKSGV